MSDDNTFEIKFRIDDSDAKAKKAAADKRLDDMTAHADRAAKRMAAGMGQSATSQAQSLGKVDKAARDLAGRFASTGKQMADSHAKAAAEVAKSWESAGGGAAKFADSIKSVASAQLGFGAILGALKAVGSAFGESNKQIDDYARNLIKVKDDLKELATLRGLGSASDEFVKEIAGFGRQTGMSITQADEYQRQFYGSIAGGQQKGNIDEATAKQLAVEAGKVASRQTKDFATRGDLIGVLAQFKKYDTGTKGVQQALADAEAIRLGLTEGRGDDAPLTKGLLSVAGSLAGEGKMVGTLPEMASLIGVMSLSAGAGQADTRTEQLIRGVRGETPDQMSFLKDFAGIDEHDNLERRLDKLIPRLREMKAAGRDIPTFLTESKINAEQSRAISEAEANYELIKKRMASARAGASGADIMAESARMATGDVGQRQRLADAAVAAAQLERGIERQAIMPDVTAGKAALVARGEDTSVPSMIGDWFRYLGSFGTKSGLDVRAEAEAIRAGRAATGAGMGFADYATGIAGMLPVVGPLAGVAAGTAGEGFASATGVHANELLHLRASIDRMVTATEAQTRAIVGAVADQTKQLTPGKVPVGPLAPARPGAGWTR